MFPLVSVIIPCFNGVEFVSEALESALAQTHPRIEVIVIDDGSVDGSAEAIARYPVLCLRGQREGVSAARNHGVRESKGDYIVFLDADDRLLPNAIRTGLDALAQHPECCMAVGAHNVVAHSGELIGKREKPLHKRDYYACLLRSNFIECIATGIFRREVFFLEGFFKTGLHAAEDYDFYLRLARKYPVFCYSEVIAEYRLHQTNVSHDAELMLTSTLQVIHAQRRYVFGNPWRIYCFSYGLWSWRRKYGRQLTRQLAISENGNGPTDDWKLWRLLARTYPAGVFVALAIRILPKQTTRAMIRRIRGSKPTVGFGHSL